MPIKVEPVIYSPALRIRASGANALVIADLHLGVEQALAEAGMLIPNRTWVIQKRIIGLVKSHLIDRLIMLGDIKHTVPETTWRDGQILPEFFRGLKREVQNIDIIPGNHDTNLRRLLPETISVHDSGGWTFGRTALCHGHRWPSHDILGCRTLVLAHNHITVSLKDELGVQHTYPCWVRGKVRRTKLREHYGKGLDLALEEVILMPSFYEYGFGTVVNRTGQRLLGPFLRNGCMDVKRSRVYLLDGSDLGTVRDLM